MSSTRAARCARRAAGRRFLHSSDQADLEYRLGAPKTSCVNFFRRSTSAAKACSGSARIKSRIAGALIGDFALGALLVVRDGVDVRASDSDQDDFIKNRMTVLGEARDGLAIWNPTWFAEVELAAA